MRIIVYVFLIAVFIFIFLSIRQRNIDNFSTAIRTLLSMGLIAFVFSGRSDLELRQEIAVNYRMYQTLKSEKSLKELPSSMPTGIKNTPPTSKIIEDGQSASKGKFFTWGIFKLKSLELGTTHIAINPKNLAVRFPETVNINDMGCWGGKNIELEYQRKGTLAQDFKSFRGHYCIPRGFRLPVGGEVIPDFNGLRGYFYPSLQSHLTLIEYKNYLLKGQPFITTYNTFDLFAETPLSRLWLDILGEVVADMNGNVKLIRGKLYTCNTVDCSLRIIPKSPSSYKFGQCGYPQGIEVYLTNFADGSADWHFKISHMLPRNSEKRDLVKRIRQECEIQRLPYFIKNQLM